MTPEQIARFEAAGWMVESEAVDVDQTAWVCTRDATKIVLFVLGDHPPWMSAEGEPQRITEAVRLLTEEEQP